MSYLTNEKGKCLSVVLKIRPSDSKVTWACNRYCSGAYISLERKECYHFGCKGRSSINDFDLFRFMKNNELDIPEDLSRFENKNQSESENKTPPNKYFCQNKGCSKRIPKGSLLFCSTPCQRQSNRKKHAKNTRVCTKRECTNLTISPDHMYCSKKCRNTHNKRMQRLRLKESSGKIIGICKKEECINEVRNERSLYCSKTCRKTHNKRMNRLRKRNNKTCKD